jgi:hypothetical protein
VELRPRLPILFVKLSKSVKKLLSTLNRKRLFTKSLFRLRVDNNFLTDLDSFTKSIGNLGLSSTVPLALGVFLVMQQQDKKLEASINALEASSDHQKSYRKILSYHLIMPLKQFLI